MEQLPPGFRFYPTEEELITFYLRNKIKGFGPDLDPVIPTVNIYSFEPAQLPGLAGRVCQGETEQWFFFIPQQEREARGGRPNRTTSCGYWKATGSPTYVYSQNKVIGVKKTMVFYKGKAPTGRKTKWKMNEYKAIKLDDHNSFNLNSITTPSTSANPIPELRHELSLCRVYITSGCARAFDRRPAPARTSLASNNTQTGTSNNDNQGQTSGRTTQNNSEAITAGLLMERSSSTESSNSGGNDHNTLQDQAGTSNVCFDIEMTPALEPLWDWEQLNWL